MKFKNLIFLFASIIAYFSKLNNASCPITLDLGIMIDVSGSIGKSYYDSMIQIMLKIADRINHKNQVFTSVIKYSTTPNIINVKKNLGLINFLNRFFFNNFFL